MCKSECKKCDCDHWKKRFSGKTVLFSGHNHISCLFALVSDEPELFLSQYNQTAILHAAHFRRVVNVNFSKYKMSLM